MLKKLCLISFAAFLLASIVFIPGNTYAATTVTPETVARIRARCTENIGTLNRLHQTDAFLRNDRGELYRTISDKLMIPLNRRLASNQLDAGPLLAIAANYNQEYSRFFNSYVEYDNAMTKLLAIDCSREPVAFYNALLDAREKRVTLSKSNLAIKDLVRQYGAAFGDLRAKYESDNK